jgi:hypothetical protein
MVLSYAEPQPELNNRNSTNHSIYSIRTQVEFFSFCAPAVGARLSNHWKAGFGA